MTWPHFWPRGLHDIAPRRSGCVLGAGVFCIYWSFWPQADGERPASRGGFTAELRDHLTQAGYPSISPSNVIVGSIVLFVVTFLLFAVLTKVVPIALCFAVMAAAAPISLVRMRAREPPGQAA